MKIGVTGHQARPGIEWSWVAEALLEEITLLADVEMALTSLAKGSDQVFAKCVLKLMLPLTIVVPLDGYESYFQDNDLEVYRSICRQATIFKMAGSIDEPEKAFFNAGRYIVEQSGVLFAVWDEKPAYGLGGTGDIVKFAQSLDKAIVIINPMTRCVKQAGV